ncbi:MAG: FHA domain-containing protein [Gemmataceae bacterium]
MSFQLFIYYCAVAGGWAAFLAAAAVLAGVGDIKGTLLRASLTGALVGGFVAAAVGFVDSLLNDKGAARFLRTALCGVLGAAAGVLGGAGGQLLFEQAGVPIVSGWVLVGTLVGASVGAYDVLRGLAVGGGVAAASRKVVNGVAGGLVGGLLGGVPFAVVQNFPSLRELFPRSSLAACLVLLGVLIGLSIGLAQVILKEAWLKVEEGFRAGRELMLSKGETTIGRAESCDLGLFGDSAVQRVHARIVLQDRRYLLEHAGDEGQTYLNDQPVGGGPVPLRAGDRIRIGKSVLQFGERQKRK